MSLWDVTKSTFSSPFTSTAKIAVGLVKGDLKSVGEGALGLVGGPLVDILKSDTAKKLGAILAPIAKVVDEILPDAGDIVEDLCDQLLPEKLQWVGDILSLATNLQTGNVPAAICDAVELFNEINDATDPGPPEEAAGAPPEVSPYTDHCVVSPPPSTEGCTASPRVTADNCNGDNGQRSSSGPSSSSSPSSSSGPSSSSSPSSSSGTSSSNNAGPVSEQQKKHDSEKIGRDAAAKFIAGNNDPESFMAAIRDGKIPDDVMGSQAGMLMIQQRMEQISRMFQMMTQMMDSMHKIQMEIVRNIHG